MRRGRNLPALFSSRTTGGPVARQVTTTLLTVAGDLDEETIVIAIPAGLRKLTQGTKPLQLRTLIHEITSLEELP